MILKVCRRLATQRAFVKPTFSKIQNAQQLLHDKEGLLKQIKRINQKTLEPSQHTPIKELIRGLSIDSKLEEQLHAAEFTLQAEDGLHHAFTVSFNPYKNTQSVKAANEAIDIGYRSFNPTTHFSLENKMPVQSPYKVGERELLLFNLPAQTTSASIYELFHETKLKSISFEYCMLGLPAVARVQVETAAIAKDLLAKYEKSGLEHSSGRLILVRGGSNTPVSASSLQLKNRVIAISNIPTDTPVNQIFSDLSRFGRVTSFYAPLNVRRKAGKQEMKEHLKNSDQIYRLIEHKANGSVDVEYFPPSPDASLPPVSEVQLNNYIEKVFDKEYTATKAKYDRRLKYSTDVDCFELPEKDPVVMRNRGYCIVQYSCMQEAQNCYFQLLHKVKVQPAVKFDFEYDQLHKKELLRYIQRKVGEHQLEKFEQHMDTLLDNSSTEVRESLMDELLVRDREIAEIANDVAENDHFEYHSSSLPIEKENRASLRGIKKTKLAKSIPKSFDQLAQLELFGKVLPQTQKELQKKPQQKHIELDPQRNAPFVNPLDDPNVGFAKHESERLDNLNEKMAHYQHLIYLEERRSLKERTNPVKEQGEEGEEGEQVPDVPDVEEQAGDVPKAGFSTTKPKNVQKPPSKQEVFDRIKAYNQMVRGIIDEYFGIFSQEKLRNQQKTYRFPTLNMNRVFKQDHTDFVQEKQLPLVLRMHSDQQEAYDRFYEYHRLEQAFKSLPYGTRESMLESAKANQSNILQHLADYGEVEEVFEVPEGEDAEAMAKQINLDQAKHGEHYSVLEKDGKQLIVKTARLDPLLNIQYVEKLKQSPISDKGLSAEDKQFIEKAAEQAKQTGKMIPDSVYTRFGKEETSKAVEEALNQLIEETGIPRKFFETALSLNADKQPFLGQDFARQLEIERARLATREVTPNDLVKSPEMVDVKSSSTAKYRVSRYRQK